MGFGLSDEVTKSLKKIIQDVFGPDTDLRVYVFGSRATGKARKNSDIDLALKSKSKDFSKKIYVLKERIENSNIPFKVDIVNWDEILSDYLPQIKKQKKLFWTKNQAEVSSPWRVCPIGFHPVREHLKNGNTDATNFHCRRNSKNKDILKGVEIEEISKLEIFKNPSITASVGKLHFLGLEDKFDLFINGWCAYWNDFLRPEHPLHPNVVKALMASESSFNQNPPREGKHVAIGLMQLMPKTITLLSSRSNELKDHFVDITLQDAFDPNKNICAAIRWLFRKYEIAQKKQPGISWTKVIENYKGIQKQKGKKSDKVRSTFYENYDLLEK